jgi:O-antigen/teichoic acid export membrane protein
MTGTTEKLTARTYRDAALGLYRRILGERPGEGAKKFFKSLGWIGICFALAKVVSGLLNVAAGRMLGPVQYGQISVLVATGAVFIPFLTAGMDYSIMKYAAHAGIRDRVFTTAALAFLALTLITGSAALLFSHQLGTLLGVSRRMLFLAFFYAAASGAFILTSCVQQSLGLFVKRGAGEIAFSAVLIGAFFLCISRLGRVYEAMACAYIAAFVIVTGFWVIRLAGSVKFSLLDRRSFLEMAEYSACYFGTGLAGFFALNVQSLVLNSYLAAREVGIYAAYFTASMGVAGYASSAICAVLFPKASASTNRARLWELGLRMIPHAAPLVFLFLIAAEIGALTLMGRHQYGITPLLVCLFAACGTLMLVKNSLAFIVFSEGIGASRLALRMAIGAGLLNFTACLLLIPRFKVAGAAIALILTYSMLLAWLFISKDAYLNTPGKAPGGES